jgi:mannitol-1-/sugar-/sorbitol-6-phosphatase
MGDPGSQGEARLDDLRQPAAASCKLSADAILFDLDGVLVDSTHAVEALWRAFANRHSLHADTLLDGLHGRRMVDIMAAAVPELSSTELVAELTRIEDEEADSAATTVPFDGARELTQQLGGHAHWAIVTSGTERVATARLRATGMTLPPALLTGDEVAAGKPSPEPYQTAAERLGVPPGRCVVVEDAPAGVVAAAAAGCTTLAVATSHHPSDLRHADHVARHIREVKLDLGPTGRASLQFPCLLHPS